MLQKIFKKRSFRRPHKNIDYRGRGGNGETVDSDSFDDTSSIGTASQVTPNGYSGPPIAQPEGSPNSETGSLKKVTFNDPGPLSPVKSLSPDKKKTDGNTDLFDGSVLEAFQTGDLSIADFLKTPLQSPNLDIVKKNRSFSDFGIPSSTSENSHSAIPVPRKQSLLDRAHSMNYKALQKPTAPAVPEKNARTVGEISAGNHPVKAIRETKTKATPIVTNGKGETLSRENGYYNDMEVPHQAPAVNRDRKPRFSSSLETLAQEVFGDEFQDYLVGASKSPVKISLAKTTSEVSSDGVSARGSEETRQLMMHKPIPQAPKKMESLHVDVSMGRGRPLTTSRSFNSRDLNHRKLLKQDSAVCKSLDIPAIEMVGKKLEQNLESWHNKADLSSNSFSPANSIDDVEYLQRMKPIMEGKVISPLSVECLSPQRSPNHDKSDSSLSKTNIIPITNNQFEFVYRGKLSRLSTSDSQYVNVGSFNDENVDRDLSVSETSVIDINFPPPPPVEEDELRAVSVEAYEAQPFVFDNEKRATVHNFPFDQTSRYASPEYRLDFTNEVDPLIESLMSIVPLPEDKEELVPALSKALGEIVSEIIASRRKLKRMMKAIEIHQQVLKDQNRQIQRQNKEIAELRKTAYALNNLQTVPRESLANTRRTSTDRTNRQSREMVELNLTLDKLLYQCSALQKTPRDDSYEQLDTDEDGKMLSPGSPNIRRVKSFPSRKLKYAKAVIEDETTVNS